jgi:hypothetical protein
MMTEQMAFVDSRSETLIQTVDVLTSFLRRLLAREITGDGVSQALGRLQICNSHNRSVCQRCLPEPGSGLTCPTLFG